MLELKNVTKNFAGHEALRETNLTIKEGEFFSLLGPSGCGKTTLLRILGGFEEATGGDIIFDGKRINDLSPRHRHFNMVFQKYALFPHISVYDNVAFGLRVKKLPKDQIGPRVETALRAVNMWEFEHRMPDTLSGGQQQRVALARAIVNRPKILLLDEPLSALDLKLRQKLQKELLELQRELKLTFIYVTHDQEEALTLSDRIAVMNKGVIEQIGTPHDVYSNPQTLFVGSFIGSVNIFNGKIVDVNGENATIEAECGRITARLRTKKKIVGQKAVIGNVASAMIRPENIRLNTEQEQVASDTYGNCFKVKVNEILFKGQSTEILMRAPKCKKRIALSLPTQFWQSKYAGLIKSGSQCQMSWRAEDTYIFANGDAALEEGV